MFKKLLNFIKVTKEEKISTEEVEVKDSLEEKIDGIDSQSLEINEDVDTTLNIEELENNTTEEVVEIKNEEVWNIQSDEQVTVKNK
ncbi:hypothetical protein [Paraclostridium sp. AKS73]|uniref:hypothetical protein n=1 Tax=Paraclostridium sp. AKS73 TaxID=2876116 RepID=UPI0021E0B8D0|nr:hypothetical protein [Paraclostridium sp. AKS73]MCU9815886.1 hypothetical protein [Paraclostridium sp. AKS73]